MNAILGQNHLRWWTNALPTVAQRTGRGTPIFISIFRPHNRNHEYCLLSAGRYQVRRSAQHILADKFYTFGGLLIERIASGSARALSVPLITTKEDKIQWLFLRTG